MEKTFLPPSDGVNTSVNTIEASIEIVRKKRRRKKRCNAPAVKPSSSPKSDRISLRTARTVSSLKSTVSISKTSRTKILAPPETTQRRTASIRSKIGQNSRSLFSANSSTSMPETRLFNRPLDANSLVSEAVLSDTFMFEYEKRLINSQMNLQSEVNKDWEALSQQISPRDCGQNSPQNISEMEIQYQSEVTFNQVFYSPAHESNFELLPSEYQDSVAGDQSSVNDFRNSVNERIPTQSLSLNLLTKQNHQIATQLQGLECYVRKKMEAAEDYVKTKLTQIEELNRAIVKALNDLKSVESDETNRRQRVIEPVRSQRDCEHIQTQQVNEPIRIERGNEPIRSERGNEVIRPQRDNEPIRLQRDNEPIRLQRDDEPIRIEGGNELIKPPQVKEPIRIDRKIETRQANEVIREKSVKQLRSTNELVMPNIPISVDFSLVILNIALKNSDYMEQFVSEASRLVTLNAYNFGKSVRSVLTELFSINLLVKYRWSTRTFSSSNKPTFSSLTNILRAISHLLINYMSAYDVRKEIKAFFNDMPSII